MGLAVKAAAMTIKVASMIIKGTDLLVVINFMMSILCFPGRYVKFRPVGQA
ncbi:MAG: hypothetical protein JXD22_12970 [Sedimentisphaerales bacterium]|nr:hypothetical protein [Sedimentisphaerales bacterium]